MNALIIVSAKADLSFPNVSIGNPVIIGEACRNDIVLAETMTKASMNLYYYQKNQIC